MGLGPPVCQHCKVLGSFSHSERKWYCEYCGETNLTESAGFDDKQWKQLNENEKEVKRFYNFWRKKMA